MSINEMVAIQVQVQSITRTIQVTFTSTNDMLNSSTYSTQTVCGA